MTADAALLGFAGSMRTFAPPAVLAARGRVRGRPRVALVAMGLQELAYDKIPGIPSRAEWWGVAARGTSSGLSAASFMGPEGGAVAAASAVGSTYLTVKARQWVCARTGWRDQYYALAEDAVCVALLWAATRRAATV
ncbi:MAG: hypothetical protein QOF76_3861 [Solirubrobacteraceae bacterium]|jgi:hypothetical protein|nr:hypothetical protein [Solirubrobacteraceae bacterium]